MGVNSDTISQEIATRLELTSLALCGTKLTILWKFGPPEVVSDERLYGGNYASFVIVTFLPFLRSSMTVVIAILC